MVFNTVAVVYVKADGTVELRHATPAGTVEPTIKATAYRTNEDARFLAMDAAISAIVAVLTTLQTAAPTLTGSPAQVNAYTTAMSNLLGPPLNAMPNLVAAIAAFNAAAASYLSTVAKVE